jgi:hypothetical protein
MSSGKRSIVFRSLKTLALALLLVVVLGLRTDVLRLNPAQQVALPHRYSLVEWEAGNLLSKWLHRVAQALPWNSQSAKEKIALVPEYFKLGEEVRSLDDEVRKAAALTGDSAAATVATLEAELDELKAERKRLRNDVEEVLEGAISGVLSEADIASWGGLVFPPVDVRFATPPKLLVTSPRDRIQRTHDVLLDPDVSVEQSEAMEGALSLEWDLSGLVVDVGGLATYPASIVDTLALQSTLRLASHEWLHHYLFFRPLGSNIDGSSEMRTLNETLADIAGREIGDAAFKMFGGTINPPPPATTEDGRRANKEPEAGFDFASEMRATRQRVDELLAGGAVKEAEEYMDERRRFFVDNGAYIRRLNQAYFAFYGTYAESPTSVSPIGEQLHQLRELIPDLGRFLKTVASMESYQQFLDTLEQARSESAR